MGKRIEVSLGFLAMICLLAWYDWKLCVCFLIGLLFHETGHTLVMALLKVPITGISFRISGAVIHAGTCSYRQEILCAAAGPAVSLLMALIGCRLNTLYGAVNGLLFAVNMLPLYPLDGGRILKAALLLRMEEEKALHILSQVTFLICCLMMMLACWVTAELQAGIWPVFAVLVLLIRVGNAGWKEK